MKLDTRENIELYQAVYDHFNLDKMKVIDIKIRKDKPYGEDDFIYSLEVKYEEKNNLPPFQNIMRSYNTTLEKPFWRNYDIDTLLGDEADELNSFKNNRNLKYLRLKSKYQTFRDNYKEKLLDHLKVGTPVSIGSDKGVVNRINDNETAEVYFHSLKQVKSVNLELITLRDHPKLKPNQQLNQNLLEYETTTLIRMKNSCYGVGYVKWDNEHYPIEEIKDVLNHREHIERKPDNNKKKLW